MLYLKVVFLAIVEGVTEFLPISSTGHLILLERRIDMGLGDDFANAFSVIIQLPAIMAIVVLFWSKLWPFGGGKERERDTFVLWAKIVVAVLPAIVLGLLFDDFIESKLMSEIPVAFALIIGGVVLILLERRPAKNHMETLASVTFKMALLIGFFQCLGMFPGTSRSAATIIGAMLLGASRPVAAEFSFFLAIPTMLGATVLTVAKHGVNFTGQQWAVLGIGSVVSFIVAYASVALLMSYIQRRDFSVFGYYRIVLGALVLIAWCFWG